MLQMIVCCHGCARGDCHHARGDCHHARGDCHHACGGCHHTRTKHEWYYLKSHLATGAEISRSALLSFPEPYTFLFLSLWFVFDMSSGLLSNRNGCLPKRQYYCSLVLENSFQLVQYEIHEEQYLSRIFMFILGLRKCLAVLNFHCVVAPRQDSERLILYSSLNGGDAYVNWPIKGQFAASKQHRSNVARVNEHSSKKNLPLQLRNHTGKRCVFTAFTLERFLHYSGSDKPKLATESRFSFITLKND